MTKRDRRLLMILGGVAVVAAAFFFVTKGSKTPTTTPVSAGAITSPLISPTPTPSTATKKKAKEVLVFSGRDPFDPAQGGGTIAPLVDPLAVVVDPAVSPAGSPSSGPSGGSSTTIGSDTVVLVSVFTADGVDKVQVEVDGTVYTVAEGDTFGDGYQLLAISGSCADFTHDTTSFTLCETANK